MNAVAIPLLLFAAWKTMQLKAITRGTTAAGAIFWALMAALACLVTAVCRLDLVIVTPRIISLIQYLAAVLLLTPLIHILGARRPGVSAWPWFVVLPLIMVLQWPALSEVMGDNSDAAIQIPTPTVIGFLLVLLMGSGNYFGTACTASMLCGTLGTAMIVLPVTEWVTFSEQWLFLPGCTMLAIAAALLPRKFYCRDTASLTPARLWSDFRDLYGIVWTKRVMDRVNQFAERECWDVRVTLEGFQAVPAKPEDLKKTGSNGQAEQSDVHCFPVIPATRSCRVLCWVLRRFATPEFFRRYLPDTVDLPEGPVN